MWHPPTQVYETHSRIALEGGDLSEFKICFSRLGELKAQGLETKHFAEFTGRYLLAGGCACLASDKAYLSLERALAGMGTVCWPWPDSDSSSSVPASDSDP